MTTEAQHPDGRERSGQSLTIVTGFLFVVGLAVITDLIGDNINIVLSDSGQLAAFVGGIFVGFVIGVVFAAVSGIDPRDYYSETRPWYIPDKVVLLAAVLGAFIIPLIAGGQLATLIGTQLGLPELVLGSLESIIGGLIGAVIALLYLQVKN